MNQTTRIICWGISSILSCAGVASSQWTSLLNGSPPGGTKASTCFPLEKKWDLPAGGYWGFRSSPAVHKGLIYVGSINATLFAVDAATGEPKWSKRLPDAVRYSSPAVDDGGVYVGCEDGALYAFDHDGSQLWRRQTGARIECSPIVADQRVYIGNTAGKLLAVSTSDGHVVWDKTCDGPIFARPTVADGMTYVGTEGFSGGTLYAFDAASGREEFTFRCKELAGRTGAQGGIYGAVLCDGDRIYFGSMDGRLYCLNAITGKHIWEHAFEKGIAGSPALADGVIVVGVQDHHWYGIDAATGQKELWSVSTDKYYPNLRSPVIVNSMAIVQYEYLLVGLDLTTGKEVGSYEFSAEDGPIDGLAVAGDGNRLYTCTRFRLFCLESKP